jgi:Uma2 family endonuclease
MSVALVEHTGPWTPDDVEALPNAGDHTRFEVFEGGVLVVSPAPGVAHQRASYWLHRALAQAATTAEADVEVLEAVNVAIPGSKLLVPDVVVVAAEAVDETTTRIPAEAVLAVVEVVSPSTVSIDRAIKPAMYADAAIPVYWRVELQDTPRIVVSSLSRGRYVTRTTAIAGARSRITRPLAVEIDPADLTRRIS